MCHGLNYILASQGKVAAWERLIHTFGQRRQLPVLAKHVPTERPRLRNTAYEMVRACPNCDLSPRCRGPKLQQM